jgi:hypothetical protein
MADRMRDASDKAPRTAAVSDLSSVDIMKDQPLLQAQVMVLQGFPQCTLHGLEFNTLSFFKGQPPDEQLLSLLKKQVQPLSLQAL